MSIKGGDFIIKKTESLAVFVPEEWNEEEKMLLKFQTAAEPEKQRRELLLSKISTIKSGLSKGRRGGRMTSEVPLDMREAGR